MKKLLLILAFVLFTGADYNDFCDGFNDGYKEGYCYDEPYGCISPPTPICPIPEIGKDTYRDGYNCGFLKGREDAE